MFFPDTIAAYLSGKRVRMAPLVEFMFTTGTVGLWNGKFVLTTNDNKTWAGMRNLGKIDGLEETLNGASKDISVSISGANLSSQAMAIALAEDRTTYVNQLMRVWLQFFDENWYQLDSPFAIVAGLMGNVSVDWTAGKVQSRTITITGQNIFYNRRIAPFGFYDDRDQQSRSPGDLGLQYISTLQARTIPIPW